MAVPAILHIKKAWGLDSNPFPSTGIASLGGTDPRENGTLYSPDVQRDKLTEAVNKFVLGAAFSSLRFGYIWSLGVGTSSDARGFGKSSTMQYVTERTNEDFGRTLMLEAGLDEEDARANPICAVMASFDTGATGSLNAVFFEATRYACRARIKDHPTLHERLRERMIERIGSDEPDDLRRACDEIYENLRGRTLGPPLHELLDLLCGEDTKKLGRFIDEVSSAKRTRSGANYFATFLLFVRAAGVQRVLLCADQLEDLASTINSRQKRQRETERFRDYILELQPMSDMLSVVVTMHPRATQAIGDLWRLADLPSYEYAPPENEHRVVVLRAVRNVEETKELLEPYLEQFRKTPSPDGQTLYPFTDDAVQAIFDRSSGKARDILRTAQALIEKGAVENWEVIDADHAVEVLDGFSATGPESAAYVATTRSADDRTDLWGE